MHQKKVWVINDETWSRSGSNLRAPDRPSAESTAVISVTSDEPCEAAAQQPGAADKNPALAFSLAMLIWGSGHLYLRRYRIGWLFLAAMVLYYTLLFWYWPGAPGRFGLGFVAGGLLFGLLGPGCWLINAVDAYYRTQRLRSAPFRGLDRESLALAGSALFPGWGQFLNGQPLKGVVFLLFGGLGLGSLGLLLTIPFWGPVVATSAIGAFLDRCFAATLVLLPCSLLAWTVSVYDAAYACRKLLRKKLAQQNPGYRAGGRGLLRNLLPRSTAVLGLLLALSLGMQFIPRSFYLDSLDQLGRELAAHHLETAPRLLQKARDVLNRPG
jgi:TM2 domain-containing membrane protein YozV